MVTYNESTNASKRLMEKPEVQAVLSDAKSLKENASKLVSSAKDEGVSMIKEGKKYAHDMAEKDLRLVRSYVEQHPMKSMAFAVLGGLVLSSLLGRK